MVAAGDSETGHENPDGALLCAALLKGYPLIGLRHVLKRVEGTVWHRIAKGLANIQNGDAPERLISACKNIRLAGFENVSSSQAWLYARIGELDGNVDEWLASDPKVKERRAYQRNLYRGVEDMYTKTQWMWEKWLPKGYLSMVVGRQGVGKSMVGVWLAKTMTAGGLWPDGQRHAVTCSNVLGHYKGECDCPTVMWIDTEGTQPLFIERCKQMGVSRGKCYYPAGSKQDETTFPQIDLKQDRWREIIHGVAIEDRPDWIHIDSLRGSHTGKEDDSDMQHILSWAAALCRDLGNTFTFTHHLRKSNPGEPEAISLDSIRGSSVIPAMMRVIIALDKPDPRKDGLRLHQIKNNLVRMPEAIGLELAEDGAPEITDEIPEVVRAATLTERAMDFLEARLHNGPRVAEELYYEAKQVGISDRTLQRAKAKLELVVLPRNSECPKYRWALREVGDENRDAEHGRDAPF